MTTTAALDQIAAAFAAIVDRDNQPTVPGAVADTGKPVTINRVRTILSAPETSPAARDRIWAHLVHQARDVGYPWSVVAAGLAIPGLRHAAARAADICFEEDVDDCDAEVLAGFVNALADIDTTKPRICSRLCQAAFSAGRSFARRQIRAAQTRQRALESRMPPPVSGHVDLVLAEAVHEGIITRDDAAIIGATRLDHQPLGAVADRRGEPAEKLFVRRAAAEAALADWITSA